MKTIHNKKFIAARDEKIKADRAETFKTVSQGWISPHPCGAK
jgi:hypothetical protein